MMEELLKIANAMQIEMPSREIMESGMGEEALHATIRVELEERFLIEFDEIEDGWVDRLAIVYAGEPVEYVVEEIIGAALWEGNMDDVLEAVRGVEGDLVGAVLREIGMEGQFERIAEVALPVKHEVWLGPEVEW